MCASFSPCPVSGVYCCSFVLLMALYDALNNPVNSIVCSLALSLYLRWRGLGGREGYCSVGAASRAGMPCLCLLTLCQEMEREPATQLLLLDVNKATLNLKSSWIDSTVQKRTSPKSVLFLVRTRKKETSATLDYCLPNQHVCEYRQTMTGKG